MAKLRVLIAWWQMLPLPWRSWRILGQVCAGDEVPDQLPRRGVVLVGPQGQANWLAFDCPCPIGHRLMVNLNRTRTPFWRIERIRPLSIRPSIYDITPSRSCHFVLSDGKVRWVNTTGGSLNDS